RRVHASCARDPHLHTLEPNDPAPPALPPLSLHDALPIFMHTLFTLEDNYGLKISEIDGEVCLKVDVRKNKDAARLHEMLCSWQRSEEHTSELQSRFDLVCRLLLEREMRLGAKRATDSGSA